MRISDWSSDVCSSDLYDGVGALKDMVQNHLLQLLALVAMEPPVRIDSTAVRNEKVKVLRSLRPMNESSVLTHSVKGQYGPGAVKGQIVVGYDDELGRDSDRKRVVQGKRVSVRS